MLQVMRDKFQGMLSWIIVGLIVIAFALFGVGNFLSTGVEEPIAAQVFDQKVTWRMVDIECQRRFAQYALALRQNPEQLKLLKNQVREILVQEKAILYDLTQNGFVISKDKLLEVIRGYAQFQEDGHFSIERYNQKLPLYGFTDLEFQNTNQKDLLLMQVKQGLLNTAFSLPKQVEHFIQLNEQKRDFGYVRIPVMRYLKNIVVSDTEAETFYKQHHLDFVLPEQVKLTYLKLALADLKKQIKITDQDLRDYYNVHQADFVIPAQIKPQHILLSLSPKATPELEEKTRKQANDLFEQLQKGADFEALAKAHSQEQGLAQTDGVLGWFERGQTAQAFEEAAFALKVNEISKPVRSQYGYHIIRLLDRKPEKQKPFKAVKADILKQLQGEQAEMIFSDKAERLATLTFESPDELESAAEMLALPLLETDFITNQLTETGLTASAKVVDAAFSEVVLEKRHNSDLIKLDEDTFVVLRVKEHLLPRAQPLPKVEKEIKAKLALEKAKALAEFEAKKLLKSFESGASPESVTTAKKLDWIEKADVLRTNDSVHALILKKVFSLPKPTSANPQIYAHLTLNNGDPIVLNLNQVKLGKIDPKTAHFESQKKAFAQTQGQQAHALYVNAIRQSKDISLIEES